MTPELIETIRIVLEKTRGLGLDPVLVGALASEVRAGETPHLPAPRNTQDADFALKMRDWSHFKTLRETLVGVGFRQDTGIEHRLYRGSTTVDLIPYGAELATADGSIEWPKSGHRMTILGFQEACELAEEVTIAGDLRLRCLEISGFVLLKLMAYDERRRKGNRKFEDDARDILYWCEHYVSGKNDERRYDLMTLGLREIEYESAGAGVLGIDAGRLAFGRTHEMIAAILEKICSSEEADFITEALRMESFVDEASESRRRGRLIALLRAFRQGYEVARPIISLGWQYIGSDKDGAPGALSVTYTVKSTYGQGTAEPTLSAEIRANPVSAEAAENLKEWCLKEIPHEKEHRVGAYRANRSPYVSLVEGAAIGHAIGMPEGGLRAQVSVFMLGRRHNIQIRTWRPDQVPPHVRKWFEVLDRAAWRSAQEDLARRASEMP